MLFTNVLALALSLLVTSANGVAVTKTSTVIVKSTRTLNVYTTATKLFSTSVTRTSTIPTSVYSTSTIPTTVTSTTTKKLTVFSTVTSLITTVQTTTVTSTARSYLISTIISLTTKPVTTTSTSTVLTTTTSIIPASITSTQVVTVSTTGSCDTTPTDLPGVDGTGTCPDADGNYYEAADGRVFQIGCNQDLNFGADITDGSTVDDFESCMDECGTIPGCNAIVWLPESTGVNCWAKPDGSNPRALRPDEWEIDTAWVIGYGPPADPTDDDPSTTTVTTAPSATSAPPVPSPSCSNVILSITGGKYDGQYVNNRGTYAAHVTDAASATTFQLKDAGSGALNIYDPAAHNTAQAGNGIASQLQILPLGNQQPLSCRLAAGGLLSCSAFGMSDIYSCDSLAYQELVFGDMTQALATTDLRDCALTKLTAVPKC